MGKKKLPDEISDSALRKAIKDASRAAVNENMAMGIPFLFCKDGIMYRRMPDGTAEFVKELKDKPIKVTQKFYKLG